MLAGLIINIIHFSAVRTRAFLQLGTVLVIVGIVVITVGEIYEMRKTDVS